MLVTHAHPDHASGAPAIAARAPQARFAKVPWPGRDEAIGVAWEALADGQEVDSPAGPLQVVHTPGHAPDHVALWHAASRTVFTGDLLVVGQHGGDPGLARRIAGRTTSRRWRGSPRSGRSGPCPRTVRRSTTPKR